MFNLSQQRLQRSPDSVRHAVRPQGPHHAQSLEGGFVLPLLWKFLLFWTFGLHKLFPAFGWALNVSVQVLELLHGTQWLAVGERKCCDQWEAFCSLITSEIFPNTQQNDKLCLQDWVEKQWQKEVIFPYANTNDIHSNRNAEQTRSHSWWKEGGGYGWWGRTKYASVAEPVGASL